MNQKIWLLILFHTQSLSGFGGKTEISVVKKAKEEYLSLAGRETHRKAESIKTERNLTWKDNIV